MNSRTLKLLTASSAFVAAASVGHADTISTSLTGTQYTSSSVGGFIVTGSGSVTVNNSSSIEVNSTNAVSNTITVNTSGILQSTSATIVGTNASNAAVVIINSGTIANISSSLGKAIDLSTMTTGANTITNYGLISGSITTGAGTNKITNSGTISGSITLGAGSNEVSSTGVTRGNIVGGAAADSVNFVNAIHAGNVTLGNGANSLLVSTSSYTGNYTGGTGVDTVTVRSGSTFTGNIDLATGGGGADVLAVSNSRVNGNITTAGASGDTLTLTNATISGTIIDGANNDADTLNINGQNTFTTLGNITNYETVNVNTNTVLNNALTGTSVLNVAANKTFSDNASSLGLTTLNNNGIVNIAAGSTLTATTYTGGLGSSLGIALATSNTATGIGKLVTTNAIGATSATINVAVGAGYIASGTTYLMVDGSTGTASNTTLLNADSGVYRFKTVATGSDINLVVGRVATDSVVTGSDNKSIAKSLDALGASSTGTLATVQGVIGSQQTAAGVNNVVESLTPGIEGAGTASVGITVDTGNQISNRLASVRSTSGVATGDPMSSQHMWVQGFGSTVSQDDHKGNSGYDANSGGVSIGADTDMLVEGVTTGAAISYGHGTVDSNASSNASTDIDSYIGTLYGSRVMDNGVFFNGQLGFGYNKYDMDRTIIGVGKASGDTNGIQGTAKLEAGRDYALNSFTLTPLASLQYTYLNMDSYTESGAGGASLHVNPDTLNTVDAGAGGQLAYAIPLTSGGTLKPSVHAKYLYRMGDTRMGTTSNFTGGGGNFTTDGVESERSSVNLGAGLLLTTIAGTDFSLNYDADIRSSYIGHTGQLKARWAF